MLKDPQTPRYAVRCTHRSYTPQFKAELVAACLRPGASIGALALEHGMNANMLHRWLKEHRQGLHCLGGAVSSTARPPRQTLPTFIPIELGSAPPASTCERTSPAPAADIRIECQRPSMTVTLHWPLSAAADCAKILRELLR